MILNVKVITKSAENAIVGYEGEILKIRCKAPPEKGRANELVIAILAKHFKVPKSAVKILSGKTSAKKRIEIIE